MIIWGGRYQDIKTRDMNTYNNNNVIKLLNHYLIKLLDHYLIKLLKQYPDIFIYHLIHKLSAKELITLAGKLNGANIIIAFHAKLLEEKTAIELLRKKIVQYNFHFLEKGIELKADEDANLFIEKFLKKKRTSKKHE